MTRPLSKEVMQEILDNIQVEVPFNNANGDLPFALFNSDNPNVRWVCGHDEDGETIVSVFVHMKGKNQKPDRKIDYLKTIEDAREYRKTLIDHGWQELAKPKITFDMANK